jgi:hypothetical protein
MTSETLESETSVMEPPAVIAGENRQWPSASEIEDLPTQDNLAPPEQEEVKLPDPALASDNVTLEASSPGKSIAAEEIAPIKSPAAKEPERRQDIRHPFHWRAVMRKEGGRDTLSRTLEISKSGCSLVLAENHYPGQKITLFLEVPAAHPGMRNDVISLAAKIIRATLSSANGGFVLGMQFTKPESSDVKRLHKYLLSNQTLRF